MQPIEFVVSASIGALLVVAVAVLRIYLGWAYVGDRLLSAAVEYEETGWYDGQVSDSANDDNNYLSSLPVQWALVMSRACMLTISMSLYHCIIVSYLGVREAASDFGAGQAPRAVRGILANGPSAMIRFCSSAGAE